MQDSRLAEAPVNVHPLVSTRTLTLTPDDLLAALRADGHAPEPFALPEAAWAP
ncbi:hypothetical protein ACLBXO_16240 [Methylobacterium sp. C33D]|uniref:hypothetical protein n=1 Tax=Methylobacterium mesophilicum TaxID=39956 RepID=UPI002F34FB9C